jgi:hypothetical protein
VADDDPDWLRDRLENSALVRADIFRQGKTCMME